MLRHLKKFTIYGSVIASSFNDDNLKNAVNEWITDSTGAALKYGPIGAWDVSKVTNLGYMFYYRQIFDEPIGGWDVSRVTSMHRTFDKASACLLYTSPSPRDKRQSRMPSSA